MTDVMRAFVLSGPGDYAVQEVPAPVPAPGEAVIAVALPPVRLRA